MKLIRGDEDNLEGRATIYAKIKCDLPKTLPQCARCQKDKIMAFYLDTDK